ncbi:hypothetical protein CcaCcLH18_05277 [Colletotrichum camelliae]|nr:hypothetical protein CcaCcLH18_05277 [Colletotrichum camelliae]
MISVQVFLSPTRAPLFVDSAISATHSRFFPQIDSGPLVTSIVVVVVVVVVVVAVVAAHLSRCLAHFFSILPAWALKVYPIAAMAPPSDETERRNRLTRQFFEFRDNCRDAAKTGMLVSILESFGPVESSEAYRRDTITDRFMQQLSKPDDALLPKKLDAAESFVKALESKHMCGEYLEELSTFCKAEWPELVSKDASPQLPSLPYIHRLDEKLAILKDISEAELPGDDPTIPSKRFDQSYVTENVWAAFWTATVEELELLRANIRSGRVLLTHMEQSLVSMDENIPTLIALVMNKKYPRANRSAKSGHSDKSDQSERSTKSQGSRNESDTRDRRSIRLTRQRDGDACQLLGTKVVTEATHIYPVAKNAYVDECKKTILALAFVWGQRTRDRLMAALGINDLDQPLNMIIFDHIPHHLWDTGRITFEPSISLPTSITLLYRTLEPLDLRKRNSSGSFLDVGLATDPRTKTKGFVNPVEDPGRAGKKAGKEAKVRPQIKLISAVTQHEIRDGHPFTIKSSDPKLLPNADLLDLRNRVMAMVALKGGADVDDDVLSSTSGGDGARRVLVGDRDVEVDLEDKVLDWSGHAREELAQLTANETDDMVWTSSVIQQPENVGDMFLPEGQQEDRENDDNFVFPTSTGVRRHGSANQPREVREALAKLDPGRGRTGVLRNMPLRMQEAGNSRQRHRGSMSSVTSGRQPLAAVSPGLQGTGVLGPRSTGVLGPRGTSVLGLRGTGVLGDMSTNTPAADTPRHRAGSVIQPQGRPQHAQPGPATGVPASGNFPHWIRKEESESKNTGAAQKSKDPAVAQASKDSIASQTSAPVDETIQGQLPPKA